MAAPWARGARVRIIGKIHGEDTTNVIHFATNTIVSDGPNFDQLLLQLAQAVRECVLSTLLPAVSVDWQFLRVEAAGIHPVLTDPVIASGTPLNVGERGATSVSFASAMAHIRTGGGGRRGRGRIFLPPPGEAEIAQSTIDEATLVLLAAFLACLAAKFFEGGAEAEDWRIGVLSRANLAEIGGTFDNSFRTATQMTPAQDVAVMGSRKRGHGA